MEILNIFFCFTSHQLYKLYLKIIHVSPLLLHSCMNLKYVDISFLNMKEKDLMFLR